MSLAFLLGLDRLTNALLQSFFSASQNDLFVNSPGKANAGFAVACFCFGSSTDSQIRSYRAFLSASQKYLLVKTCLKRKCLQNSRFLFLGMFYYIIISKYKKDRQSKRGTASSSSFGEGIFVTYGV